MKTNVGRAAVLALLLACSSSAAQEAEADEVWIEHFDKASGKPFYYQEVSRKTAWEPPAGGKVKYMDASEKAGGGSGSETPAKAGGSNAGWILLIVVLIIGGPFIGLFYCYWAASKEGLSDVLKALAKKNRNRSAKRRVRLRGGSRATRAPRLSIWLSVVALSFAHREPRRAATSSRGKSCHRMARAGDRPTPEAPKSTAYRVVVVRARPVCTLLRCRATPQFCPAHAGAV